MTARAVRFAVFFLLGEPSIYKPLEVGGGGRAGTLGSEVTLQLIGVLLCLMLDYAHRCRTSTLIMVPI